MDSLDKGPLPPFVEDDDDDGMGNLISIQQVDDAQMQLQTDYNEVLEKYQHLIGALQEEQRVREEREHQLQSCQLAYRQDIENLKKQHEMAVEAAAAAASTSTSNAEEAAKLEKLKSAYQKLRMVRFYSCFYAYMKVTKFLLVFFYIFQGTHQPFKTEG